MDKPTLPLTPAVPRIWIHDDVMRWLEDAPSSQRGACLRALEGLLAHGKPNRMKGVKGTNMGWLRTPLGGTHGKQYYLWFANAGAIPVKEVLESGEILVREVRHHDRTDEALNAGTREDWQCWTAENVLEQIDAEDSEALTKGQRGCIAMRDRVHLVLGGPGTGKTTTLLHGLRSLQGRILYLTLSGALAEQAQRWCATFTEAPIEVMTFGALVAQLAHEGTVVEPTRARIDTLLDEALRPHLAHLGSWLTANQIDTTGLYAELFAHIVGRSLSQEDYLAKRGPTIGDKNAKAAWEAGKRLDDGSRAALFPSILAAQRARTSLEKALPDALVDIDWIVVDEIQDLTVVEAELLIALAQAIGERRGVIPGLRLAGDEGQTLRPTGFTWAELKTLLSNQLSTKPIETQLASNVRSARAVARLAGLIKCQDKRLAKNRRPAKQTQVEIEPVEGGEVVRFECRGDELPQAAEVLRRCGAIIEPGRDLDPKFAVSLARSGPLRRGPAAGRAAVGEFEAILGRYLTSETVKGLDFETTAVLGVGARLVQIGNLCAKLDVDTRRAEMARSCIDHLRVAVTRATDVVVLVEVDADDASRRALDTLYAEVDEDERPRWVSCAELAERLETDTGDLVTRITEALMVFSRTIERDPKKALDAAEDAFLAYQRAGRTGALGETTRREIFIARARARIAVTLEQPVNEAIPTLRQAQGLLGKIEEKDDAALLLKLIHAFERKKAPALTLMETIAAHTHVNRASPIAAALVTHLERAIRELCVATIESPLSEQHADELQRHIEDGWNAPPALELRVARSLGKLERAAQVAAQYGGDAPGLADATKLIELLSHMKVAELEMAERRRLADAAKQFAKTCGGCG